MGIREKLLAAKTRRRREPLPQRVADLLGLEPGEKVYLQEATASDLDAWENSKLLTTVERGGRVSHRQNLDNIRARLLVYCLVDKDGKYICENDGDAKALGELPAEAVKEMYEIAARLNGLRQNEEDAPLKNGHTAASSTVSPSSSGGAASNGACGTSGPEN